MTASNILVVLLCVGNATFFILWLKARDDRDVLAVNLCRALTYSDKLEFKQYLGATTGRFQAQQQNRNNLDVSTHDKPNQTVESSNSESVEEETEDQRRLDPA